MTPCEFRKRYSLTVLMGGQVSCFLYPEGSPRLLLMLSGSECQHACTTDWADPEPCLSDVCATRF